MFLMVTTVLLFGFIHPGSKLLLDSSLPLSFFCIMFIGIRAVAQIAVVPFVRLDVIRDNWLRLVIFGCIGAGLQYLEFLGIDAGLDPGTVTFLVFCYPLWILLYGLFNSFKWIKIFPLLAITVGLYLITGADFEALSWNYLPPLLAGGFMALWVWFSSVLSSRGLRSFELSLCYDFVSLLVVVIIFIPLLSEDWPQFKLWIAEPSHVAVMVGYSLLIGGLPNILFYKASKYVLPMTAAMIMANEPIVSTVYSQLIWREELPGSFYLAALLILSVNLPASFFSNGIHYLKNIGFYRRIS